MKIPAGGMREEGGGISLMDQKKENVSDNCCTTRHKERSEEEIKSLVNRLSRIEGQVRGIRRMVEEGVYCPEILTQSAAVSAAMNGV